MALKVQSSFAKGELDPALQERTTLDSYKSGLKTLRNAVIGKTGRIISRPGRNFFIETKLEDSRCILFSTPYSDFLLEWGHEYVRVHDTITNTYQEAAHPLLESDLDELQFEVNGNFVYIFCAGKQMLKLNVLPPVEFVLDADIFSVPAKPTYVSGTPAGTGYAVEYVVTYLENGQESIASNILGGASLPDASNINTMKFKTPGDLIQPTEFRFYRRPETGGVFGFVGASSEITYSGTDYECDFTDVGGAADYSHTPPTLNPLIEPIDFFPKTGIIYQQRLILTRENNKEALEASRPGYLSNFYRDYPISADSALTFKAGASGNANVIRMIDDDGLVVFTTKGIYTNAGPLTPTNLGLIRKGEFVIKDKLGPVSIPGGVIFADDSTNTIRTLLFSTEAGRYLGEELSIWSNHFFVNREIKSWAFQDGDIPLVWVTFDDGRFAALTYQREHEMKAWSRHDSSYNAGESRSAIQLNVEFVTVTREFGTNKNVAYFVVEKEGKRWIEKSAPRYVTDVKELVQMDSTKSFITNYGAAVGGATFTVTPTVSGMWDQPVTIESDFSAFQDLPGEGAVGTIFTHFDDKGSKVELVVTEFVSDTELIAQPSLLDLEVRFPEENANNAVLYTTYTVLTGLDHLEGEFPMIHVDGNVICSPNNDVDELPQLQVIGGEITLPDKYRGAFVHVGRPFISDVETLDVDTVEQAPTLVESINCNKLYVKMLNSRGLFVGNKFPFDGNLTDMERIDQRFVDYDVIETEEQITANRCLEPSSRRREMSIPGDWQSQGRVCLRSVDGLGFEILSLIPDLTVERRRGN